MNLKIVGDKEVRPEWVTEYRLEILKFLAEKRFATTGQLYYQLGRNRTKRHHTYILKKMAEFGLIHGFVWQPERGSKGERCWLLRPKGANLLQKSGVSTNYGSQHRRLPGREQIRHRSNELKLVREIRLAGWQVLEPQTFSSSRPLPRQTPQFIKLAEILNTLEQVSIEQARLVGNLNRQREIDFQDRLHLQLIPRKINEFVAWKENRAVVLVLTPERAGKSFWFTRLKKYSGLSGRVPVIGIFVEDEQATHFTTFLEKAGLKIFLLSEIYSQLKSLEKIWM